MLPCGTCFLHKSVPTNHLRLKYFELIRCNSGLVEFIYISAILGNVMSSYGTQVLGPSLNLGCNSVSSEHFLVYFVNNGNASRRGRNLLPQFSDVLLHCPLDSGTMPDSNRAIQASNPVH